VFPLFEKPTRAEAKPKINHFETEHISGTRPVCGILLRNSVIVPTNKTDVLDEIKSKINSGNVCFYLLRM
jgi:hypothetical protein